ncbi:MAG TPA: hypothetical protein VF801_16340 [Rhodocyclaceae bacterium]
MAYEVTWETSGAYKKFAGHVSDEELRRSVSRIHGDRRFDDLRYVINDFLAVESYDVSEENVMYIAAIDGAAARSNPNIRIALVLSQAHGTELALRYASAPWTVYPTRIFHSTEEARAWAIADVQPATRP